MLKMTFSDMAICFRQSKQKLHKKCDLKSAVSRNLVSEGNHELKFAQLPN